MATVEKVSVALTAEMVAMLREAVETGEYASASDVMREALRDWKQRRAERIKAVETLGRLWDDGIASGPVIDGDEAFGNTRRKLEAKAAAVKVQ